MKVSQNIYALWKLVLVATALLCMSHESSSQVLDADKSQLLVTAEEYYETQDYLKALGLYKPLVSESPSDPVFNYRIGVCMYNLKDQRPGSRVYFEKAIESMPQDMFMPMTIDTEVLESYYYLGMYYHLEKEFDLAVKMFQVYQNYRGLYTKEGAVKVKRENSKIEVDNYISKALYAKEQLGRITQVVPENMGEGINSPYPDYAPILSADGSQLIFTSRRKGTGGLTDPRGEYFEDIYYTHYDGNRWVTPTGISANINTDLHDAGISLSVNGEKLMLYRTNKALTGGDIYNSELVGNEWSSPIILTSSHYVDERVDEGVNTSFIEPSASLNRHGDVLFFSSDRPGGYGGLDLYRVVKLPDGEWGLAVNLGPTINTPFDEDAPFIHPDDKTLFFSSKGHPNMGGYDIFKTVLSEESGEMISDIGMLWSVPENLKAPINSVADDIYYVLSPSGKTAYFSSDRKGGLGGSDIYTVSHEDWEGLLIVVKGTVISLDDRQPLSARLTVMNQLTRSLQGEYNTNPLTGEFVMILSPKMKYKMILESQGHYSFSEEYFLVSHIDTFTILNKEIYMQPVKIEVEPTAEYLYTYVLENVHFESQKHDLLTESESAFTTLIRAMIANSNMRIEIAGHTDDSGGQMKNLELSQKRADAVKAYLMSKGISELRLISRGYGESTPIASNISDEGKAKNRRTEIRVIDE